MGDRNWEECESNLESTTETCGWKPPELAGRRPTLRSAAIPAASSWGFQAPRPIAPPVTHGGGGRRAQWRMADRFGIRLPTPISYLPSTIWSRCPVVPLSCCPFAEMHELIIEPGRTERNYWRDLWRYLELFYFLGFARSTSNIATSATSSRSSCSSGFTCRRSASAARLCRSNGGCFTRSTRW